MEARERRSKLRLGDDELEEMVKAATTETIAAILGSINDAETTCSLASQVQKSVSEVIAKHKQSSTASLQRRRTIIESPLNAEHSLSALQKRSLMELNLCDTDKCQLTRIDANSEILLSSASRKVVEFKWLQPPKNVLILKKPDSLQAAEALVEVARYLSGEREIRVIVEPSVQEELRKRSDVTLHTWTAEEFPKLCEFVDFIVCLGGDGTILFAETLFDRGVPPILSFAFGSLGFLTNFGIESYRQVLDSVLTQTTHLTLRMRLCARIVRGDMPLPQSKPLLTTPKVPPTFSDIEPAKGNGPQASSATLTTPEAASTRVPDSPTPSLSLPPPKAVDETFQVLNEVLIDRGPSPFLTKLCCHVDGIYATTVQGDGLIVATPTGSTAYSLAAGGSMVHPSIQGILFTPVCPHSLSFRPLILPDVSEIRVSVPKNSRGSAWVSFDGRNRQELFPGDSILITRSPFPVAAFTNSGESCDWVKSITETLQWNQRKEQG